MPGLSDIPHAAVEAAHDQTFGGVQANRFHIRMMLAAALPVLHTAKDSETAELLRTAVFEISQMRAEWVNAYLDRAQKAWRGGSWRSTDADRVEREAIDKWNASHLGLIALWKSYEDRAASLRGEQ